MQTKHVTLSGHRCTWFNTWTNQWQMDKSFFILLSESTKPSQYVDTCISVILYFKII